MKLLRELIYRIDCESILGNTDISISSIHFNSSQISTNSLFIAIKGVSQDGHDYILDSIKLGAIAIICEQIPEKKVDGITYVKVKNSSNAMGILSSNYYDNPSRKLKLIGITGTNGKTSIAYFLFSLFQKLNIKVGLLSTIEYRVNTLSFPSTHTTPNPIELNRLLSIMVEEECEFCFMEVSSHGISQNRISGLQFCVAIFSNLSRDHLDYHSSFNDYLHVKKSFFDSLSANTKSIINIDDPYGKTMVLNTKSKKIYYTIKNQGHYSGKIIENNLTGLSMELNNSLFSTFLVGEFNAYNLLAVYATAIELGQTSNSVLKLLSNLSPPSGRFNVIKSIKNIVGIIDYAHTPDALNKVILSISNFCILNQKLIIVIGCGGDRDTGKRSIIGKIAAENSVLTIFTSDNPRTENPESIINDMCADLTDELRKKIIKLPNRKTAIAYAVSNAKAKSVILVAGKGHEKFQEINGVKTPFNDYLTLDKLLKK
ncbi:MAG: UDP-N-acetylmuramoyl-L-alanyl-D-glutamate--2,6-diaminopimelate ligase [Flavobacteriales bacterium]|jgi:UDP-N-acetylmuramoyl-L-alanyl-D-glutamate--2,6-diaminopimelate ligase|nr:UDP-N-acetylmuramoyl-L-alanyl-D-glutamate--2,6-diaminopimelate ligase [Flavobacteriales bacterium]|tara:strand:- start:8520 stop:9974 length:1455 start_codon:yes stop_codon:yes gene_type:complete